MADLHALMSSANQHYCTDPDIINRVNLVLRPPGSNRTLFDPTSNSASIVGADKYADGSEGHDGLVAPWDCCDTWFGNFPYGKMLLPFAKKAAYWGRLRGRPGISLTPSRSDTEWMDFIKSSADAWVETRGRRTFWTPIAIRKKDAHARKKGNESELIYLQRWWPTATEDDLPKPFRLLGNGFAVGPELSLDGKPQPAPFPSLIGFWADPVAAAAEPDPREEREALLELVRVATCHVHDAKRDAHESASDRQAHARWLSEAEKILGKRYQDCETPLRADVFEPLHAARKRKPKFPIDVRTFATQFMSLGTLTIARGPHRGVYKAA